MKSEFIIGFEKKWNCLGWSSWDGITIDADLKSQLKVIIFAHEIGHYMFRNHFLISSITDEFVELVHYTLFGKRFYFRSFMRNIKTNMKCELDFREKERNEGK